MIKVIKTKPLLLLNLTQTTHNMTSTTIDNSDNFLKSSSDFILISKVNNWITAEQNNQMGISLIFIIVGSMVASISAALAIHGEISYLPLIYACISTMGTNVIAISQRPFKARVWAFLISILGNILFIIYLLLFHYMDLIQLKLY